MNYTKRLQQEYSQQYIQAWQHGLVSDTELHTFLKKLDKKYYLFTIALMGTDFRMMRKDEAIQKMYNGWTVEELEEADEIKYDDMMCEATQNEIDEKNELDNLEVNYGGL